MKDDRRNNGRFAQGNKAALGNKGGGRKGYNIEFRALTVFNEVFDEQTFRATCIQLKSHVFGQMVDVKTGKIIDDPDSTPHSRLSAWEKMANYKLGKPIQPLIMAPDEDGELMNVLKGMADSIKSAPDEKLVEFEGEMKEYLKKVEQGEYIQNAEK